MIENSTLLIISIDRAKEKDDNKAAILNLYYNKTSHIIYETHDKEQLFALSKVMKDINEERNVAAEQKKVIDIIKKKCSSGNSNLWLVTCVDSYKRYLAFVNDTNNHDHDLVRAEHNVLTEEEFNLLRRYMVNEQ